MDLVLTAGFVNRVKRRNRAADATQLEINEHAHRGWPAVHHLVDRHVSGEREFFHLVNLESLFARFFVREQTRIGFAIC